MATRKVKVTPEAGILLLPGSTGPEQHPRLGLPRRGTVKDTHIENNKQIWTKIFFFWKNKKKKKKKKKWHRPEKKAKGQKGFATVYNLGVFPETSAFTACEGAQGEGMLSQPCFWDLEK